LDEEEKWQQKQWRSRMMMTRRIRATMKTTGIFLKSISFYFIKDFSKGFDTYFFTGMILQEL
jgi:hypothetical protein